MPALRETQNSWRLLEHELYRAARNTDEFGQPKFSKIIGAPVADKMWNSWLALRCRSPLVQVRNKGGLWDESEKLYRSLQAKPRVAPDLSWTFPSGASVSYAHLSTFLRLRPRPRATLFASYIGFPQLLKVLAAHRLPINFRPGTTINLRHNISSSHNCSRSPSVKSVEERSGNGYSEWEKDIIQNEPSCDFSRMVLNGCHGLIIRPREASWRSGDAEDCKSLYPGSIPGEASNSVSIRQLIDITVDLVAGIDPAFGQIKLCCLRADSVAASGFRAGRHVPEFCLQTADITAAIPRDLAIPPTPIGLGPRSV